MSAVKSEDASPYAVTRQSIAKQINARSEDATIKLALVILSGRLKEPGDKFDSPRAVKEYLTLKLGTVEREVFGCMFMNTRNELVAYEELFYGTVDGAAVHPREVVKAAMRYNAASVFLFHNHPSQTTDPSEADKTITKRLNEALALIDVRVLDHLIVGGMNVLSFAEEGLL